MLVWVPVDFRAKSKLSCQCTVASANLDSVFTVPNDDPIPKWTRTKVRMACLLLNEELSLKNRRSWRKPWAVGELGALGQEQGQGLRQEAAKGPQARWELWCQNLFCEVEELNWMMLFPSAWPICQKEGLFWITGNWESKALLSLSLKFRDKRRGQY